MANPFTVQPLGGLQNIQMISQGMQGIAQNAQAERQQEQLAQAQQAVSEAFQSGDVNAIRQAMIQYPEMAEQAKNAFGFTNEQTERVAREAYRRVLSDPENAPAYMQQGIQQVAEFGGRPSMMMQDLQMLQENPEAALQNIRAGYAALASEEEFGAMFGDQSGPNIGQYNPRDYTTDSFARFVRTGDPRVLQRYESSRVVDVGGVPHLFNPASQTITPGRITSSGFQATGEPVSTGAQPITSETVATSEAEIAGQRTEATETARQRAKQESPEVKEQRRLKEQEADRTVQLVDRLLKSGRLGSITGASTTIPVVGAAQAITARDELNDLKALTNLLTMGNLGRMSGVLSESDIRLIANAASGIEVGEYGTPVSEGRLKEILREIKQRLQNRQDAGSGGGSDVESLINKYAD